MKPRWKSLTEMLMGIVFIAFGIAALGIALDTLPALDWHWISAVVCIWWGGDLVKSNWEQL
jgi:hypothetical protein